MGGSEDPPGLVLNDEIVVLVALQFCSDTGKLDLGAVGHGRADQGRHGAGESADINQAGLVPLLELGDFTLFGLGHGAFPSCCGSTVDPLNES